MRWRGALRPQSALSVAFSSEFSFLRFHLANLPHLSATWVSRHAGSRKRRLSSGRWRRGRTSWIRNFSSACSVSNTSSICSSAGSLLDALQSECHGSTGCCPSSHLRRRRSSTAGFMQPVSEIGYRRLPKLNFLVTGSSEFSESCCSSRLSNGGRKALHSWNFFFFEWMQKFNKLAFLSFHQF